MDLIAKVIVSIIVILSCSSLGFTKPIFLNITFPHIQAFNQQSLDQDTQPEGDYFQPEESIHHQESDAASSLDMSLDSPIAHNRTARDAKSPCFSHVVKKFDWCRKSFVNHVHCFSKHVACLQAINSVYSAPRCKTVYGFLQARFVSECHPLPIGCQCDL